MSGSDWDELGLAPTADRGAIRRAYAARLKTMPPERDPAAFQRLRTAYENALRRADGAGMPPRPGSVPDKPRDLTEPDPEAARARSEVAAALAGNDAAAAFAAFERAEQRGALSLADLDTFEERLLAVTVADRKLPPEQLHKIVARFQWGNSVHLLRRRQPSAISKLDARLDAERWYRELVERTRRRRGVYESDDRLAARQLLSGAPGWWRRYGFPNRSPWLGRDLIALARHREWIGDRFDPARLDWCRGQPAMRGGFRMLIGLWFLLGLLITFGVAKRFNGFLFLAVTVQLAFVAYLRRRKQERWR